MYHLRHPKDWDDGARVMSNSIKYLREDATFVPEVRSPTVRRRELGALLRQLRTGRGLTVEQAAEQLMISMSKLSRMETGQSAASLRDIRDLCDLYEVTDEAERDRMVNLAREGKQTGWWQGYDLESFATYVGLEAAAVQIRCYQSAIIPGLLQTPDYARAMHAAGVPEISPERTEELIEVRLRRQRLLDRDPPVRLDVIIDAISRLDAVGLAVGERIRSLDINPLIIRGDEAIVVDALLIAADPAAADPARAEPAPAD